MIEQCSKEGICIWLHRPSYHSLSMCHVMLVPHTVTHTPCVVLHTYRVQRDVVSLYVYKDGDWLQLGAVSSNRYVSINTLVMCYATAAIPIPVGDHVVLIHLRYPVHSSQYYKQRSSHRV